MSGGTPRVTFGVAVRNGAPMIEAALQSVVDQDVDGLEILVSDNASTDATPEIVEAFRRRDSRVRVFRHETPLRVLDHFHWVKDQARGEYFAWAAHDDWRSPDFASLLADALDRQPRAVLAFGDLHLSAEPCGRGELEPWEFETAGRSLARRVLRAAYGECFHLYGLWRREAIARIPLAVTAWWPDLPIMTAAACLGDFIHVPGAVFGYHRVIKTNEQRAQYQDLGRAQGRVRAAIALHRAVWRTCSAVAGPVTAAGCVGAVATRFAADLPGFVGRRLRERAQRADGR